MLHFLVQVAGGSLFHLGQDHRRDFFSLELLGFSHELNNHKGLAVFTSLNLERPKFHVLLYEGIFKLPTDESLGIEDSVARVTGNLVLGGVSYESFGFGESNIRRGGSVSLIIGNDIHSLVLPDTHTGVSGSQIYSYGGAFYRLLFTHFIILNYTRISFPPIYTYHIKETSNIPSKNIKRIF
jgi:hypothetical protein